MRDTCKMPQVELSLFVRRLPRVSERVCARCERVWWMASCWFNDKTKFFFSRSRLPMWVMEVCWTFEAGVLVHDLSLFRADQILVQFRLFPHHPEILVIHDDTSKSFHIFRTHPTKKVNFQYDECDNPITVNDERQTSKLNLDTLSCATTRVAPLEGHAWVCFWRKIEKFIGLRRVCFMNGSRSS
jgi:hypothetical protein